MHAKRRRLILQIEAYRTIKILARSYFIAVDSLYSQDSTTFSPLGWIVINNFYVHVCVFAWKEWRCLVYVAYRSNFMYNLLWILDELDLFVTMTYDKYIHLIHELRSLDSLFKFIPHTYSTVKRSISKIFKFPFGIYIYLVIYFETIMFILPFFLLQSHSFYSFFLLRFYSTFTLSLKDVKISYVHRSTMCIYASSLEIFLTI